MERTKLLLVGLLLASAFAFLFISVRHAGIADESAPGLLAASDVRPAPLFTIANAATGAPFSLEDQRKTGPVVLDFWATWCGPCRAELPHLERLSQKYQGRIAFYGINSDDPPQTIALFAQKNYLTFPMLSDTSHQVASLYGASAIPLVIVIDSQGNVRAVSDGYSDTVEADLTRTLDALLASDKK